MPVTRESTGKLLAEDFESMAVGAPTGWTDQSQSAATFEVASGSSKFNEANHKVLTGTLDGVSGNCRLIRDEHFSVTDYIIQAFIDIGPLTNNARPGLVTRWGAGVGLTSLYASYYSGIGPLETEGIWLESADGTRVHAAVNLVQGDYYILQLEVEGAVARARIFSFAGVLLAELTVATPAPVNATATAGVRAIGNSVAQFYWDHFRAFTSTSISATGLPSGWKVRAGGTTAIEDGSGTATVDFAGRVFPIAGDVEILDGSDTVQETITPDDGVWGGDVYAFEAESSAELEARFSYKSSGQLFAFDGSESIAAEGDPIALYSWVFGDQTEETGESVQHQYELSGSYVVTLTVTTISGATDSTSQVVSVDEEQLDELRITKVESVRDAEINLIRIEEKINEIIRLLTRVLRRP